jgi:MFS family permease
MSWKIALLVAFLNALLIGGLTILVADYVTRALKVSDFEGGRGMAVFFFFVPAGLIGGALLGVLGTKLAGAVEWSQFWKAMGAAALLGNFVLFGIAGFALLSVVKPPLIDGRSLALELEFFVPPSLAPAGDPKQAGLQVSLYAGDKDNQYSEVDTARIRSEEGYLIVPATAGLNSVSHIHMVSFGTVGGGIAHADAASRTQEQ